MRDEKRPVVPLLALLESTAFKLSNQKASTSVDGTFTDVRTMHRHRLMARAMDIITVNEAQRHLVALRRNAYWHASSRRLIDSTSATSSRQDERSKGGTSLGRGLRLAM